MLVPILVYFAQDIPQRRLPRQTTGDLVRLAVNLPFASQIDGTVDLSKLPMLTNWSCKSSIETILPLVCFSIMLSNFYLSIFVSTMVSFTNQKLQEPLEGRKFF